MAAPTTPTRALRNLYEDITHAHKQLTQARRDGGCDAIIFWAARVDELLDRLSAQHLLEH